jgi:hypothetical protein
VRQHPHSRPLSALASLRQRGADDRPDFNWLSVGLINGPVAGRGFGMPFLASSLDELMRSGLSCE